MANTFTAPFAQTPKTASAVATAASASQISILADHDATLSGVIGFGRAMVSGGKLLVAGTIAPTVTPRHRQALLPRLDR